MRKLLGGSHINTCICMIRVARFVARNGQSSRENTWTTKAGPTIFQATATRIENRIDAAAWFELADLRRPPPLVRQFPRSGRCAPRAFPDRRRKHTNIYDEKPSRQPEMGSDTNTRDVPSSVFFPASFRIRFFELREIS